jgi:Uma2 family endonuclease
MLVAEKKGPATYADIEALPEHLVGEIIDGELIVSPRPAPLHALAESHLLVDIGGPFDRGRGGPGGWVILGDPELHFGPQVMVPDLAGWRRERMPRLPATAYFELPPDWLCEVLSPSTARIDRAKKMRHYAKAKVQHVWLLDPLATTLEVYRLDPSGWLLVDTYAGDTKVRPEPFDAVELDLAALWSR